MKQQTRTWRLVARVLVLAMMVVAVPLPSLAEDNHKPPAVPGLQASIAKAAIAGGATLAQAQPAQAKPAPNKAELGSTSFFKKPVGVAVLAIVGAGIGYMAYSMSNDRIHSVARQNQ